MTKEFCTPHMLVTFLAHKHKTSAAALGFGGGLGFGFREGRTAPSYEIWTCSQNNPSATQQEEASTRLEEATVFWHGREIPDRW